MRKRDELRIGQRPRCERLCVRRRVEPVDDDRVRSQHGSTLERFRCEVHRVDALVGQPRIVCARRGGRGETERAVNEERGEVNGQSWKGRGEAGPEWRVWPIAGEQRGADIEEADREIAEARNEDPGRLLLDHKKP